MTTAFARDSWAATIVAFVLGAIASAAVTATAFAAEIDCPGNVDPEGIIVGYGGSCVMGDNPEPNHFVDELRSVAEKA